MQDKTVTLVFFGSANYSLPLLEKLLEAGKKLWVVTTPDRPVGRQQQLSPNPVAEFAQKKGLPCFKLENLTQIPFPQPPLLGICCVYGKIIPASWIDYFSKGIINIHPSLLPKYRGPSPAQFALLNQEKETGVTFIKIDEKCDHGPILWQIKEKITPTDTADSLYRRLFGLAAQHLLEVIKDYLTGKIKPRPQDHSQATFTRRLTKKDGYIPLPQLFRPETDRKRRAFYPWPGIYTQVKIKGRPRILKILQTHLEKGKLVIDQVQLEGKRPVTFAQFSEAYPLF